MAPVLYGSEIAEQPDLLERQIEIRLSHAPSWIGYTHQLNALVGWTSLPWLRPLDQPTRVLAGDEDPIIPLSNARVLAARIPRSQLHVARGGGHLFHITRAEEIAGVVRDFLDN